MSFLLIIPLLCILLFYKKITTPISFFEFFFANKNLSEFLVIVLFVSGSMSLVGFIQCCSYGYNNIYQGILLVIIYIIKGAILSYLPFYFKTKYLDKTILSSYSRMYNISFKYKIITLSLIIISTILIVIMNILTLQILIREYIYDIYSIEIVLLLCANAIFAIRKGIRGVAILAILYFCIILLILPLFFIKIFLEYNFDITKMINLSHFSSDMMSTLINILFVNMLILMNNFQFYIFCINKNVHSYSEVIWRCFTVTATTSAVLILAGKANYIIENGAFLDYTKLLRNIYDMNFFQNPILITILQVILLFFSVGLTFINMNLFAIFTGMLISYDLFQESDDNKNLFKGRLYIMLFYGIIIFGFLILQYYNFNMIYNIFIESRLLLASITMSIWSFIFEFSLIGFKISNQTRINAMKIGLTVTFISYFIYFNIFNCQEVLSILPYGTTIIDFIITVKVFLGGTVNIIYVIISSYKDNNNFYAQLGNK